MLGEPGQLKIMSMFDPSLPTLGWAGRRGMAQQRLEAQAASPGQGICDGDTALTRAPLRSADLQSSLSFKG